MKDKLLNFDKKYFMQKQNWLILEYIILKLKLKKESNELANYNVRLIYDLVNKREDELRGYVVKHSTNSTTTPESRKLLEKKYNELDN